jgi:hypothetical protein
MSKTNENNASTKYFSKHIDISPSHLTVAARAVAATQ